MKKLIPILFLLTIIFSCDSDDNTQVETFNPKFKFTFNWNGEAVNLSDFNDIKYTNENGQQLSITRMRYLLSNIILIDNDGNEFGGKLTAGFPTYKLVNIESDNAIEKSSIEVYAFDAKQYKSIKFTVGFDEEDNAQEYPDLNVTNWNWRDDLGAGYHIMQYEGIFINVNDEEQLYAMHLGTRRVSEGVFEPNHFPITLNFDDNTVLNSNSEIEIQMNIAEWFKNPNTWDLNVFNAPLMPNYDAQLMMHENGASVFTIKVN